MIRLVLFVANHTAMPYLVRIEIEFDSAKDVANRAKHGVPLAFGAIVLENRLGEVVDSRRDYGEMRFNAFGLVDGRLFVGTYTMRDHDARRGLPGDFRAQGKQAAATQMATVRVTREMVQRAIREPDWAKLDAQTDEEIARNVASDPDAAPILTDAETAAVLVRTIRLRLGLSQAGFSRRFHIPIGTLRDWEQSRRQPDTTALAYLRVIAHAPEVVTGALVA